MTTQLEQPAHYRAAERGNLPAEALTEKDRARLLWTLYGSGMSPAQIGHYTRTTEYTVERILRRAASERNLRDLTNTGLHKAAAS